MSFVERAVPFVESVPPVELFFVKLRPVVVVFLFASR